jgi:hypothetical protein
MGLDAAYWKLQPPDGRLFADPRPGADETSFQIDNTSDAYYQSVYFELHKNDLQPVPAPSVPEPRIDLVDILGQEFLQPSIDAKKGRRYGCGEGERAPVGCAVDRERGERRRRNGQ